MWWPDISHALLFIVALVLLFSVVLFNKLNGIKQPVYFLAGFLYTLAACQIQLQNQLPEPLQFSFTGQIASLPKTTQEKISFVTTNTSTGQTYLLNWYKQHNQSLPEFQPGKTYQFDARLKPPSGTANGVGFDREKWLFRNRIAAIGTIKSATLLNQTSHHPKHWLNSWRQSMASSIEQSLSSDRATALVQALSIGDKSHFEHQDFQRFQATGTAHLIAISGLHIGMVAMIGWFFGGLLFWVWPQQKISKPVIQLVTGLGLALLYAGLAGFAVSTQRALIMLGVYAFFKATRRNSFAWDVWSFSLLLVLLLDPLNIMDAGFWLSFMAVAVLILSFQGLKQNYHKFTQFFVIQWRLLLGMLPISLLVFSQVNLLTPLVNMIMIPLMTFIVVPLIMLQLIFITLFKTTPVWLAESIENSSLWFLDILQWFSQHAVIPISFSIEQGWQMTLLAIGGFLIILPQAIPQRYWGLLLILLATVKPINKIPPGHFTVRFFDVGQGLAVHIETAHRHLLYDVGAAYDSGFNMADAVILPYFKQRNIKELDTLILSHRDNDHSGASDFLLQGINVETIYSSEERHQACVTGLNWQWDAVSFSVISPFNFTPYLKNNSSCVLKVESADGFGLLLTGDIESPVEYRLSQRNKSLIAADVLLMPHHGSKTSSTMPFFQAVNPKIVVNSAGQYNPFNHPSPEILEKYHSLGIPVFDTKNNGMVTVSSFAENKVELFRQQNPKIWRKKSPE